MQIDDVLQYILSKNTICNFSFDEIVGGLKLKENFLSFILKIICERPSIRLGPSC